MTGLSDWARTNQEDVIKGMPADAVGDEIDLDKFMIFGGSYEDTKGESGRRQLMAALLGRPIGDFEGFMKQNRETEDQIDANAISGLVGRYRADVEEIQDEWNSHYAALHIEAEVEEAHHGGIYITVRATVQLDWELDNFVKLPNSYPTGGYAFDSINDIWGDIFNTDSAFINKFSDTEVRLGCDVNLQHPDAYGEELFSPDEFNELCKKIDVSIDDKRDGFKATLEEFLKREGWMEGGTYLNLAIEIEDGGVTSYEWDLETDGEYSESYESYAFC